jgi:hypothetical protein
MKIIVMLKEIVTKRNYLIVLIIRKLNESRGAYPV